MITGSMQMRYLSLFSGIEAASCAWRPLGWECAAVAEIEPFPCAVLKARFPNTPNLGDVTAITRERVEALGHVDVVVFGFPCQDLSVAGKRKGLKNADGTSTRSGLFFPAARIAEWSKARWTVVENVPGLFSQNGGRDFAAVVGELAGAEIGVPGGGWRNAGVALGPKGLVEWAVLDARFFGVAQRRRRVFIVRDAGNWADRPPLLLERESLCGHSPPRREAREETPTIPTDRTETSCCISGCGRSGELKRGMCNTHYQRWRKNGDAGVGKIRKINATAEERFWHRVEKTDGCWNWTGPLNEKGYGILADEGKHTVRAHRFAFELLVGPIPEGLHLDHKCKNKRCVRPDHLEPVTLQENTRRYWAGDTPTVAPSLAARTRGDGGLGTDAECDGALIAHSLRADGFDASEDGTGRGTPLVPQVFGGNNTGGPIDVAPACNAHGGPNGRCDFESEAFVATAYRTAGNCGPFEQGDKTAALNTATDPNQNIIAFQPRIARNGRGEMGDTAATIQRGWQVRRLTVRECERLMGLPDDYTLIEYNGKPACDGPRYRAIGNSMAVPVMRWIGERIQLVDAL